MQANAGFHDLIGEAGRDITGLSILGILEQKGVSRDQVVGLFDTAFDGQSGALRSPSTRCVPTASKAVMCSESGFEWIVTRQTAVALACK